MFGAQAHHTATTDFINTVKRLTKYPICCNMRPVII
ncbi:hypothetical protein ANRL1_04385 [Anaerolineae bacterium]|nr:hypothetical protein ANRL1_04385 [Anaerolineae bacterium]